MTKTVALIGTGPAGFGYVQGLSKAAAAGRLTPSQISEFHIFDRSKIFGAGLPYDENMADVEHLLNVKTFSVSIPQRGADFFAWMKDEENQEKIKKRFKKIHQERLKEKLSTTKEPAAHEALIADYEQIWQSIEKRYLNLATGETYHPRVLYGVYASMVFEQNLDELRKAGITVVKHRNADVKSIRRSVEGTLQIESSQSSGNSSVAAAGGGGGAEEVAVDDLVLATGRWQQMPKHRSNRHCPDIWPARKLSAQLDAAIRDEMEKRAAEENPDKTFKVAIEGTSLSAIDALKTAHEDSLLKVGDDGAITFEAAQRCGARLQVDMVSRGGMMPKVKCEKFWFEKFPMVEGKRDLPEGIAIRQNNLQELATAQGGTIRMWQLMVMNLRAMELGYQHEIAESGSSEILERRREEFHAALLGLIANVGRKEDAPERTSSQIEEFFESLRGSSSQQALAITEFFGLDLDRANYEVILGALQEAVFATGEDSIDRLRFDMEMAATGDTKAGELIWQNIYYQNDAILARPFLEPEEEVLRSQIFERFHGILNNAMPIQTAREMIAMHEAGAFAVVPLGFDSRKVFVGASSSDRTSEDARETSAACVSDDRGVVYGERKYDFSIAARGIGLNLDNAPELYQSMLANGLIAQRKVLFCSAEEMGAREEELKKKYGEKNAAMITRSLTSEADGNFYFYNRSVIPHDSETRHLRNASGTATLSSDICFLPSMGIVGSIEAGEKLAMRRALPQTAVDVTAGTVASLEASAAALAAKR